MQGPLILVSNPIQPNGSQRPANSQDRCPRQDYVEIAQRLGAKLIGYDSFAGAGWYRWAREIERHLKLDVVEARVAATRLSSHQAVLSTSEKMAIPLAVWLRLRGREIPHVVIAHKLSSGYKTTVFRWSKLHQSFSRLICVSRPQSDFAVNQLGFARSAVRFIHDKVDHRFFRPLCVDAEDYILVVGREQRDWQTLLQATSATGLKLVIVASSPWSTSRLDLVKAGGVRVLKYVPYVELRNLYARARLVVLPLRDVDYAAGVNTALEAMSMGKPLVLSRTQGIQDYVVHGETGMYVTPYNPLELRDTILWLWERSRQRERLGANARAAVERYMNLDLYAERVAQVVREVSGTPSI
jgi:glycosyltransferase involved in cell wall biosynthesis